jgi:hypothetical protein
MRQFPIDPFSIPSKGASIFHKGYSSLLTWTDKERALVTAGLTPHKRLISPTTKIA